MVAWSRGYYGTPFKEFRGVTQGGLLSPNIFIVVVDAVLRHQGGINIGGDGTRRRWYRGFWAGRAWVGSVFYAEDGLLASMRETRLQTVFDTLTQLFDHVGLHINVASTVIMDCQPYCALGGHSVDSYGLQLVGSNTPTGTGSTRKSVTWIVTRTLRRVP